MTKRERQRIAERNFKKVWTIFGVHPTEFIPSKDGGYEVFEKDPTIKAFGGKDPKQGWGLLSS